MYVFKGARALSVTDPGVRSHVMVKLAEKKKVWCATTVIFVQRD